jgi:hypothetical protein
MKLKFPNIFTLIITQILIQAWFFFNYSQRVRVWLVALAGTKLAKENEPEENP